MTREMNPGSGSSDEHAVAIGRRRLLSTAGVAGVAGIAGCLGGAEADESDADDENGEDATKSDDEGGSDDAGEEPGDEEDEDEGENGNEADGEDGDGGDGDDAGGGNIRPSELGLEPDDAWDDDHPDVEIPDEPGWAVLVVGDTHVEMEGDVSGGPKHALYETVMEDDEFAGDGAYFLADGWFEPTEEALADLDFEQGREVRFFRRMVGWSGNQFGYVNSDTIDIHWPVMTQRATYYYRENPDGSVEDGDRAGTTDAEEPFLQIDASGVITAVGTITDPGNSEIEEGTSFEFGARAQEGWGEN